MRQSPQSSQNPKNLQSSQLEKFGFSHLLELATFAPYRYSSSFLLKDLHEGAQGVVHVHIAQHQSYPKVLKIHAHALDFDEPLTLVFFHPKPYIKKLFAIDSTLFVQGAIKREAFATTMIQPKIVREINTITPHFKTSHKNAELIKLTQDLITQESLQNYLPADVSAALVEIFHPDERFFAKFCAQKGFDERSLYALKFCEIFAHLLRLSTKRTDFPAKYRCKGDYQSWAAGLPFALTGAQQRVCKEIARDLAGTKAAKRLVMGDVGCGKTLVILASVMMAYPKKSLLMAPTSVLAKQLYEQAKLYLPESVRVGFISAESKQELGGLFANEVDFIIGTQALLYRDINGDEIALVMSDEQHRFGTKQRHYLEKLATQAPESKVRESSGQDSGKLDSSKQDFGGDSGGGESGGQDSNMGEPLDSGVLDSSELDSGALDSHSLDSARMPSKPHILQFSATPIPRTMAMLESKMIDVSIIDELPYPKNIATTIITKSHFHALLAHIQSELVLSHQVAIIYPLVEESEKSEYLSLKEGEGFWKSRFAGVYSISGQDREKERVLEEFAKQGSILLATTLIEVGISLPKLSTIIIIAPERLGLATLHQLRGRVSRNGLQGYCYLYTHTPDSARLREFAAHLSGFDIAQIDLRYRKGGDILQGRTQSGAQWVWADLSQDEAIFTAANAHLQQHLHAPKR